MTSLAQILLLILGLLRFFVIAYFILSWLVTFNVLNLRQPFVAQVWYGMQRLLEPLFGPIRRLLPAMGGIDLSPLVVIIGIEAARILIDKNLPS